MGTWPNDVWHARPRNKGACIDRVRLSAKHRVSNPLDRWANGQSPATPLQPLLHRIWMHLKAPIEPTYTEGCFVVQDNQDAPGYSVHSFFFWISSLIWPNNAHLQCTSSLLCAFGTHCHRRRPPDQRCCAGPPRQPPRYRRHSPHCRCVRHFSYHHTHAHIDISPQTI